MKKCEFCGYTHGEEKTNIQSLLCTDGKNHDLCIACDVNHVSKNGVTAIRPNGSKATCYNCGKEYETEQENGYGCTDIYVGYDVDICLYPCSDGKEHYICFNCYCELGTTPDFTVILPVYAVVSIDMYHSFKDHCTIWCVMYVTQNKLYAERICRKLREKAYRGLCGTSYASSRSKGYDVLTTTELEASKAGLYV